MLHLRLRVPEDLLDTVTDLLGAEPTTVNLAVLPGAYRDPSGTLVMADLPREGAQSVLGRLHDLGMAQRGSITIVDDEIVISEAATRAEQQAAAGGLVPHQPRPTAARPEPVRLVQQPAPLRAQLPAI